MEGNRGGLSDICESWKDLLQSSQEQQGLRGGSVGFENPDSGYSLSEASSPNMASCSIKSMEILILGMLVSW